MEISNALKASFSKEGNELVVAQQEALDDF